MVSTVTLDTMKWIKAGLPDDLHKWLRIRALEKDQTLSETIIELLTEAMERTKGDKK